LFKKTKFLLAPIISNNEYLFDLCGVKRLLWCSNSPDINVIKPSWPWLKRVTTKKGAPKSRKEAEKA
jgi:hypothetical protein